MGSILHEGGKDGCRAQKISKGGGKEGGREGGSKGGKKIVFTVPGNVAIMGEGKKVTEAMTHIHRAAQIWTFCALSKPDLTSSHRRTVTGLCTILHL